MAPERMNERSVRFADSQAPDSSDEFTHEIEQEATVEHLRVRVYPGAELDVEIVPFIDRAGSRFDLVEYPAGKDYIDGDDDRWTFDLSEPVDVEDEIGVVVTNRDVDNAHPWSVDYSLDRAGGIRRLASLVGGIL